MDRLATKFSDISVLQMFNTASFFFRTKHEFDMQVSGLHGTDQFKPVCDFIGTQLSTRML